MFTKIIRCMILTFVVVTPWSPWWMIVSSEEPDITDWSPWWKIVQGKDDIEEEKPKRGGGGYKPILVENITKLSFRIQNIFDIVLRCWISFLYFSINELCGYVSLNCENMKININYTEDFKY